MLKPEEYWDNMKARNDRSLKDSLKLIGKLRKSDKKGKGDADSDFDPGVIERIDKENGEVPYL